MSANTIVNVDLKERSYDIHIGKGILRDAGAFIQSLNPNARCAIVSDENVIAAHGDVLKESLTKAGISHSEIIVKAGEKSKDWATLNDVVLGLLDAKLERGDLVIAFGGGVVGDLAGFAAAITRRGMDFVQIPTSLLAQVDSSVGGKTGINAPHGKNLIGAFHQPKLVLIDTDVLKTLSNREFRAGYAEVAKYGLINRPDFFEWLEKKREGIFNFGSALIEAVSTSCQCKADVVASDEKEHGARALLNLGHTFGHALEGATNYDSERLVHGEGVAIGMALAHRFSNRMNLCDMESVERVEAHLTACGLPTSPLQIQGNLPPAEKLLDYIAQDKKVTRGKLNFILTKGLGKSYIANDVPQSEVLAFLTEILNSGTVKTMTTAYWILLGAILFLILLSAFFSGSETALTATSRANMHQLEKNGDPRATIVNKLIAKRDRLIGALLIGNNLVNILASALATSFFLNVFGEAGIAIATLVMTIIVVIFAEVMPKSFAIVNADRFALAVAPILRMFVVAIWPLTQLITGIVKLIFKLFGSKIDDNEDMLSAHEELRGAFDVLHKDGSVIKDDRDGLGGILDLHELEVSDVMVHRTNMVSIDLNQPSGAIAEEILASPYTRIPLWKNSSENIVGVLHTRDLLRALGTSGTLKKADIEKISADPWFVPETTTLRDQLNAFLRRKAHIALVVDEYGEVQGLVTLEDILEEIVGEIADEHDVEVSGVKTESDGSVVVDGSVPIRDLNRALDWELPDEEATTVAGLIIHAAQMIPEEKQTFTFYGKRFVVLNRTKNRITRVRIRKLTSG